MAKKTRKASGRRKRRTPEEQIADLEAELAELRARVREAKAFSPEAVQEERERLGLSVVEYAELVGVSHLTVYSWEAGRSKPRKAQLEKWLQAKGMNRAAAHDQLGLADRDRSRKQFTPETILSERDRLELSAADYAELVGVSALTIYNWEKGKTRPRDAQLERWLGVHGIGKRKAWEQLGF
jgi:DNA-binding transcriptional regulator YiaG